MTSGKFQTVWKDVIVNLNFRPSFNQQGRRVGQLITDNQFVQDAIENDLRYGMAFSLTREFESEAEEAAEPAIEEEERPERKVKTKAEIFAENKAKEAAKGKKSKTAKQEPKDKGEWPVVDVDDVTSLTDMVTYFSERGWVYDGKNFDELCEKCNVRFPNLKM